MEPTQQAILDAAQRAGPPTADDVRQAVADGLRQAVADPAMWSAAYAAMHQHAQREAGGWLLGGLRAMVSRLAWLALAVVAIYSMGGWHGVLAFIKTGGKA